MRIVEYMDKSIHQIKAKETHEFFVPFAAKLRNAREISVGSKLRNKILGII
jgi:hypothetical protein